MRLLAPISLLLALVSVTLVSGQSQPTPWDHVHFAVPDPPAAIEWYQTYIEGPAGTRIELMQR